MLRNIVIGIVSLVIAGLCFLVGRRVHQIQKEKKSKTLTRAEEQALCIRQILVEHNANEEMAQAIMAHIQ